MPIHDILVDLPQVEIQNTDLVINVKSDETLLGTLSVSRGALDWRPSGFSYDAPFSISWERFNELMQEEGKR